MPCLKEKESFYSRHILGAFQMTMPVIGYTGYKMNQISASASLWKENITSEIQRQTFDLKAKYEYTLPVKHISITSSLKPVFRALETNEIVGITVDGGGGKKVVQIKFLGRDANFQRGGSRDSDKNRRHDRPRLYNYRKWS